MPDGINIPGVSDRYKTNDLVESLMEVERVPLEREQSNLDAYKKEEDAWRGVNQKMSALRDSVKALYSYENPFNNKVVSSSDESAITADADRSADFGTYRIDVLETASADRFLSDEIDSSYQVSSGQYTFSVGDRRIDFNFRGGSLDDFVSTLNKRGGDVIRARVIGVTRDSRSLLLESLLTGADARLTAENDALTFACDIGLLEETVNGAAAESASESGEEAATDAQNETDAESAETTSLPVTEAVTADSTDLPSPGEITFEGISISNNPSVSGTRAIPQRDSGLPAASEMAQEKQVLQKAEETAPAASDDVEEYTARHAVSRAGDAKIKYEGITMTRPSNDIDDIIPNVTLHLHSPSDGSATITCNPDTESAKDAIVTFVGRYNQAIAEMNILSTDKKEVITELDYLTADEQDAAEERLGMLRGDFSLTNVKSSLQTIVSSNYSTGAISLLSQIGVSTNASGTSGRSSSSQMRGYLEIDEKRLDDTLKSNLSDVKNLFGFDRDGDLVIDDGVGPALERVLASWVQSGGIIATKTATLENQIDSSTSKIERLQTQLDRKESELRQKYANMEGTLNSLESQQTTMQNFTRQNQGND